MAPKSPWRTNQNTRVEKDAKPGALQSAAGIADSVSVNYAEVQSEELEVLQAIYMEDYQEVEVKSAWSKTSDRAFRLIVRAFTDGSTTVVLSVKLTATYPRTLPVLQVEGLEGLHARTKTRIMRIIERKSAEMLGEVMIHAIASDIQDALEDAVQAREQGTLPSLEEVRAVQEAAATEQARDDENDEVRRNQEAQAEEDRVLQQMVEEEVDRREAKKRSKALRPPAVPRLERSVEETDIVQFDQTINLPSAANVSAFDAVQLVSAISLGSHTQVYTSQPLVAGVLKRDALLAIRSVQLKTMDTASSKHDLLALEEELEALKALRHQGLVNVLAFKMENRQSDGVDDYDGWQITIMSDFANRGTLEEMLEGGQMLPLPKARQWSLDLLEALDFYHRHGIIHKSISSRNVLISRSSAGVSRPLLADAAYQYRLRRLQGRNISKPVLNESSTWLAPEIAESSLTRKSDVWDFGVVLVQMLMGSAITNRHSSPPDLINTTDLSDALDELLTRIFNRDAKGRPSAFDLIPSEFFRSDAALLATPQVPDKRRQSSSAGFSGHKIPQLRRSRHNSFGHGENATTSRYASDFTELNRLGRGGFGEVVKARNKLDGGVYAIKKIKQDSPAQLAQVLSEIMLLHRLNHAYVVRYYSAWVEDDLSGVAVLDEEAVSSTVDTTTSSGDCARMDFGLSSRGLDFVSSSGFHNIEFGNDDDDDEDNDGSTDSDTEDEHAIGHRFAGVRGHSSEHAIDDSEDVDPGHVSKPSRSASRRLVRSTLYIQMEYCERHTLRDLIRTDMYTRLDAGWQMLRQILEGLAHIHGHGIIHRDLKPDNIFIDVTGNPRIGDFGLATTSHQQIVESSVMSGNTGGDMTRSVGTTLYVAPELRTGSGATYNDKVDMYSLGIIFFEMCFPLRTAMERLQVLQKIRGKDHTLPSEFQSGEKLPQGEVIMALISHASSERPSSTELLRSGKLPLQIEDETIRQALRSLSDSGSPYYQKMMSALFSQTADHLIKDFAWDVRDVRSAPPSADEMRIRDIAHQTLRSIFRRHGAEEAQRPTLLPRSSYYTNAGVVQLLDATGNLLQLPYDLTLPHARQLARLPLAGQKSYLFGHVYRDTAGGGPPRMNGEVDFDVVSLESEDLVLDEAEVLKVVDEIIASVPALASTQMAFHINHSELLETILDFCRIDASQRPAVKEALSKLNFHQWTWQKVRAELRTPLLGIHSTSLDDLAQFDFRDSPEKALAKLESMLETSPHFKRIERSVSHLKQLVETLKLFGVSRKIFICPLASYNDKFYTDGIIFQCIHDKKNRSVFAAGGRYDRLVEAHRTRGQGASTCHAVGVNIGWDGLIASMMRFQRSATSATTFKKVVDEPTMLGWDAKRCEVLIASSDPTVLRSAGVKLLANIWAHDISAELATEARSVDDLLSRQRDTTHTWIVMVKHEASSTLKVRNTLTDTDTDVASTSLIGHLRQEMRERDHRDGFKGAHARHPALLRHASHSETHTERKSNVQVLMAQHRSKKGNKYHIVEAAQQRWAERVDEWKDAPILAIETRDDVLDAIRETRLGDPETWRKAIQGVQLAERQYLGQVSELLRDLRKKWMEQEGMREACVFNFRTGSCIYYDLGL